MKSRFKLAGSRISFDYDGTLSTSKGKKLAAEFIASGAAVFIITARQPSESESVYAIADVLGIRKDRVIFTAGKDKWPFMDKYRIGTHYDNNAEQVRKINENTQTKGILFTNN